MDNRFNDSEFEGHETGVGVIYRDPIFLIVIRKLAKHEANLQNILILF